MLSKAETERIWLPFTDLADGRDGAAAAAVTPLVAGAQRHRRAAAQPLHPDQLVAAASAGSTAARTPTRRRSRSRIPADNRGRPPSGCRHARRAWRTPGSRAAPARRLHRPATDTGVHQRPRISRRPANPSAAQSGANTKSCTTTPTTAHTAMRTMTSTGFVEQQHSHRTGAASRSRRRPAATRHARSRRTTSIRDSHFVCSTPGLVGAISRHGYARGRVSSSSPLSFKRDQGLRVTGVPGGQGGPRVRPGGSSEIIRTSRVRRRADRGDQVRQHHAGPLRVALHPSTHAMGSGEWSAAGLQLRDDERLRRVGPLTTVNR